MTRSRRWRPILAQLSRLRDERVPAAELDKARGYVSGRMELRLEETPQHVLLAGLPGGAPRSGPDARRGPRRTRRGDRRTRSRTLAQRLIRDELLSLAVISPRAGTRALEQALRLP